MLQTGLQNSFRTSGRRQLEFLILLNPPGSLICRTSIIGFWPSSIHNISEGRWIKSDRTAPKEVQGRNYGRPSRVEVIRRDGVIRNHQKRVKFGFSHQKSSDMDSSKVIRSPPGWISICNNLPWELSQAFRNPVNSINMRLDHMYVSLYICKLPPTYLHLSNNEGTSSTIFVHPLLFCNMLPYVQTSFFVMLGV